MLTTGSRARSSTIDRSPPLAQIALLARSTIHPVLIPA